jgi:hypothetical protein
MNLRWLPTRALAAGLMLIVALGVAAQDSTDKKGKKEPADPPRTSAYMNQLRLLFDTWDTNKDDYLDKKELAVAFYGAGTKPFDAAAEAKKDKSEKDKSESNKEENDKDKTEKDKSTSDKEKDKDKKAPDYSRRADYVFLTQLDKDKDDQISRDEFMEWARDLAIQLRDRDDLLKDVKKTQDQLNKLAKNAKNRATVEAKLKKQQQDINKLQQKLKKYEKVQNSLKN